MSKYSLNQMNNSNKENFIYVLFRMSLFSYIDFCCNVNVLTSDKINGINQYGKNGLLEKSTDFDGIMLKVHFDETNIIPEFLGNMDCFKTLNAILEIGYELESLTKRILPIRLNDLKGIMKKLCKFRHLLLYNLENLIFSNNNILNMDINDLKCLLDKILIIHNHNVQDDELFNHISKLMLRIYVMTINKIRKIIGNFYSNCKVGDKKNSFNICNPLHFNFNAVFLHNDVLIVQLYMRCHILMFYYLMDDKILIFQTFDKKQKIFQKSFIVNIGKEDEGVTTFNYQLFELEKITKIMHYYT